VVYVNEPPGSGTIADARKIRVEWEPSQGDTSSLPVSPGNTVTAIRPNLHWTFQPNKENIPHSSIERDSQARLNRASGKDDAEVKPGESEKVIGAPFISFTTSTCGLDKYDISVQLQGSQEVMDQVTVIVRKRIEYHYIEMDTHNRRATTYSLRNWSGINVLKEAEKHFLEKYGILLQEKSTRTGPYVNSLKNIETYADPKNDRKTDGNLYIIAAGNIQSKTPRGNNTDVAGLGTTQIASVSCKSADRMLSDFVQTSYNEMRNRNDELSRAQVNNKIDIFKQQSCLDILLHEIGHAFGLVYKDKAGSRTYTDWGFKGGLDYDKAHCSDKNCIMWWEAELTNVTGLSYTRFDAREINFCNFETLLSDRPHHGDRCSLHLISYDFSDLRIL
jgi:hypothetical protein